MAKTGILCSLPCRSTQPLDMYCMVGSLPKFGYISSRYDLAKLRIHINSLRSDSKFICDETYSAELAKLSENGDVESLKALLTYGININSKNSRGNTALHELSLRGRLSCVKILLEVPDIQINISGIYGYTPLHSAICNNYVSVVRLLLKRSDIDVNTRNDIGETPLHLASKKGYIEVVKLLLTHCNVIIHSKMKNGFTAIDLATKNKHIECINILEKILKNDYIYNHI